MSDRVPTYSAFIDWYGHGGLTFGMAGWYTLATEVVDLELAYVTPEPYIGNYSIKVTHTGDNVYHSYKAPIGMSTISVWVYNPSDQVSDMGLYAFEAANASNEYFNITGVTERDQWVEITGDVTVTQPTEVIFGVTNGASGEYYIGWSQVRMVDDDVSCDVLVTRQVPDVSYGRDSARDLEGVRVSEIGLDLDNSTGKYTPYNTISDFANSITLNRRVLVMAELDGKPYILFSGFIDDFQINASLNEQSVSFHCVDLLQRLAETEVHTELYESIRTGNAAEAILAATGLPDILAPSVLPVFGGDLDVEVDVFNPFMDSGATTLTWWSFDGNAKDALDSILEAEGPPSIYILGESGQIVFRDRHHRLRANYPETTDTYYDCLPVSPEETDFVMNEDSQPNYGWDTMFNRVTVTSQTGVPDDDISTVWTDSVPRRTFTGRLEITADLDEGYIDGVEPVPGRRVILEQSNGLDTDVITDIVPEIHDFVIEQGDVIVEEYTTSGTQIRIVLASVGTATITGLQQRGRQISEVSSSNTYDETSSQTVFSTIKGSNYDAQRASLNDAEDIALQLLKDNASPRPRATVTFKNRDLNYTKMILGRMISDSVNISSVLWNIHKEFVVEGIKHRAGELGKDHELTLYLQQRYADDYKRTYITFDEDGTGFNVGAFAKVPAESFTFGDDEAGFDEGVFGFTQSSGIPIILGTSEIDSQHEIWY